MKELWNKMLRIVFSGMYLFAYAIPCFADGGEDILKEPMKNFFVTILGTGLDALLAIEIVYGIYLYTTSERKLQTFKGIPVLILITAYARFKLG